MALEWSASLDNPADILDGVGDSADLELARCMSEFLRDPAGGAGVVHGVAAQHAFLPEHWSLSDWEWDGASLRATKRSAPNSPAAAPPPPAPAPQQQTAAQVQQQSALLASGPKCAAADDSPPAASASTSPQRSTPAAKAPGRAPKRRAFSTCRGCATKETPTARFRWSRYNVCDVCSMGESVEVASSQGTFVRFCQRCHKLVPSVDFGSARRNCRTCLEHLSTIRRRAPKSATPTGSSAAAAPSASSMGGEDTRMAPPKHEDSGAEPLAQSGQLIQTGLNLVTHGLALKAQAEARAMDGVHLKLSGNVTPDVLPPDLLAQVGDILPSQPGARALNAFLRPGCVSLTVCGVRDPASPEQIVERLIQGGKAPWKTQPFTVGVGTATAASDSLGTYDASAEAPLIRWVHPAVAAPGQEIKLRVCGPRLAGTTLSIRWGHHSLEIPLPAALPTDDEGDELVQVTLCLPPERSGIVSVQAVGRLAASPAMPVIVHFNSVVRQELNALVDAWADAESDEPLPPSVRGLLFLLGRALGRESVEGDTMEALKVMTAAAGCTGVSAALNRRSVRDYVGKVLTAHTFVAPLHLYKSHVWHNWEFTVLIPLRVLAAVAMLYANYRHPERFEESRFHVGILHSWLWVLVHSPPVFNANLPYSPRRTFIHMLSQPLFAFVFGLGEHRERIWNGSIWVWSGGATILSVGCALGFISPLLTFVLMCELTVSHISAYYLICFIHTRLNTISATSPCPAEMLSTLGSFFGENAVAQAWRSCRDRLWQHRPGLRDVVRSWQLEAVCVIHRRERAQDLM